MAIAAAFVCAKVEASGTAQVGRANTQHKVR
jgi:hypothetical protein